MSELSINFAKTGVVNNKKNIVAEKAETKNDNSSSSSAANVVLSGLGAVAAIAVGIMAIRKFQGAKVVKEIGIDKFKEAGNIFIKGQALTKDGQPFTGIITKIGKDGLKHNIEYTNGIIKEVKTYKPTKIFDGSVKDFPVSKKGYNYNAQGKLESIDNFSWAHVNTTDPKAHGFQYIKTSTTNLDKKRADGLRKFTEKQAEIKKQTEIKEFVAEVKEKLSGKSDVNTQKIDDQFATSSELQEMNAYYRGLEQKEQQVKEGVGKLKEKMHQKTEINAQKIDDQYATNNELQELGDYYKGLEAKAEAETKKLLEQQAEKEQWKKFALEHPEEAKAIRKAQKAERKANSIKQRTSTDFKYLDEYDEYGPLKAVTVKPKSANGTEVTRILGPDGKTVVREISENKNLKNTTSVVPGSIDQKVSVTEHFDAYEDTVSYVIKHKVKGKNGKYKDVQRTIRKNIGEVSIPEEGYTIHNCNQKNVYKLKDGNSLTEYVGSEGDKIQVVLDKKGNLVSRKYVAKPSSSSEPPSAPPHVVLVNPDAVLVRTDRNAFGRLIRGLYNDSSKNIDSALRWLSLVGFNKSNVEELLINAYRNGGKNYADELLAVLIKKFPEAQNEILNLYKSILTKMRQANQNVIRTVYS